MVLLILRGILRNEHSEPYNRDKTVRFDLPIGIMYTEPSKRLKYLVDGEKHPLANYPAWRAQRATKMGNAAVDTGPKFIALKASVSNPSQVPHRQSTKTSQTKSAPPLFTSENFPGLGSSKPATEKIQCRMTWGAVVSNPRPATPAPSKSSESTYSGPKRLVVKSLVNINFEEDFPESLQEDEDTQYGVDMGLIYDFG